VVENTGTFPLNTTNTIRFSSFQGYKFIIVLKAQAHRALTSCQKRRPPFLVCLRTPYTLLHLQVVKKIVGCCFKYIEGDSPSSVHYVAAQKILSSLQLTLRTLPRLQVGKR
jgi:hypothetical protein